MVVGPDGLIQTRKMLKGVGKKDKLSALDASRPHLVDFDCQTFTGTHRLSLQPLSASTRTQLLRHRRSSPSILSPMMPNLDLVDVSLVSSTHHLLPPAMFSLLFQAALLLLSPISARAWGFNNCSDDVRPLPSLRAVLSSLARRGGPSTEPSIPFSLVLSRATATTVARTLPSAMV